jgi:ABC-type antimicrobial peptide transport system permease subunit
VTSRTGQIAVATSSPLATELRRALAAIAIAAIALALAGFAVSLTAARERRGELALLDALGMPARQLGRMLRTEQLLMVVPSAAAGLALGALLAHLIIPSLTLSASGAKPVLPPQVQVPWLTGAVLAVVLATFPVLLAPLAGRFRDTVAVLRQGARE